MDVKLLDYTPNPEQLVATAAKLCYSPKGICDLMDNQTEERASEFVNMLSTVGHESPLEHISFTFGVEGISRACSHQLVRHRIASYSQKSQRYVKESNFDYVEPEKIKNNKKAHTIYISAMKNLGESYTEIAKILEDSNFDEFLEKSLDGSNTADVKKIQKDASKAAYEDARYVLPNACQTNIIVTMNARSLLNFFKLRCCNRAQWEIREVADRMLSLCKNVAPNIFKNSGPSCIRGKCTEGGKSCGKQKDMIKKYLG